MKVHSGAESSRISSPSAPSCLLSPRPPKTIINKNNCRYQRNILHFFARSDFFRLLSLSFVINFRLDFLFFDFRRNFFQLFFFLSSIVSYHNLIFFEFLSLQHVDGFKIATRMKSTRQQFFSHEKHQKNISRFFIVTTREFFSSDLRHDKTSTDSIANVLQCFVATGFVVFVSKQHRSHIGFLGIRFICEWILVSMWECVKICRMWWCFHVLISQHNSMKVIAISRENLMSHQWKRSRPTADCISHSDNSHLWLSTNLNKSNINLIETSCRCSFDRLANKWFPGKFHTYFF